MRGWGGEEHRCLQSIKHQPKERGGGAINQVEFGNTVRPKTKMISVGGHNWTCERMRFSGVGCHRSLPKTPSYSSTLKCIEKYASIHGRNQGIFTTGEMCGMLNRFT